MAQLKIENLNFKYAGNMSDFSLQNIDLTINSGEFVLLCGESGSGKSTLLSLLKPEISPNGELSGQIYFEGKPLDRNTTSGQIAIVFQNPDDSLVTDKVSHEMAFSLESLGLEPSLIGQRLSETASYFGLDKLWYRDIQTLSGGEKQLVALACALVCRPKIILLDEPCSCLDPIAAEKFISTLQQLNSEFGITIIISEHRLDRLMSISDKVIALDGGRLICCAKPQKAAEILKNTSLYPSLPIATQLYFRLGGNSDDIPLDVKACRAYLEQTAQALTVEPEKIRERRTSIISAENLFFRYGKNSPDILCGLDAEIEQRLFTCIMGGNGAGKSTLLSCLCGLERVYDGKISYNGKSIFKYGDELYRENICLLMQSSKNLFSCENVYDELFEVCQSLGLDRKSSEEQIKIMTERLGIDKLTNRHPYDLSGGELQKAAIAKLLLNKPKLLLLDEPVGGLDARFKAELIDIIKLLCEDGVTVVAVTHDLEFASHADRCMMMFGGKLTPAVSPGKFFDDNFYYTTSIGRITRGLCYGAVRLTDICGGEHE